MSPTSLHLLILGVSAVLVGGQELQLKPPQVSQTKSLGSAIVFTCTAIVSEGEVDVKWYDSGNKEITDRSGRMYIEDDGTYVKKLYITSIKEEDAGKYSCQATIGETLQTKEVFLRIFQDITFGEFPLVQNPKIYDNALILCSVEGEPEPAVSWRYGGKRLMDGTRYSSNRSSGLTIENITEKDNGLYTCRGEVDADGRYSERQIRVLVHIPPVITVPPEEVKVEQGENVSLTCKANGLPEPSFQFFKNDDESPLTSTDNVEVNETGGSISFVSVKKADEGNYTCKAINRVGSDKASGQLKVLVKSSIFQFLDAVEVQGRDVNLSCISDGDPIPSLTLRKEGSTTDFVLGTSEDARFTVISSQPGRIQLTIHQLAIEDSGNYICTANNSIGSDKKTAKVTVRFKPTFAEEKATVYNWVGKRQNLTCEPSAEPAPTVVWWLSDVVLESNDTYKIYNLGKSSILEVTVREADQSWIYGLYTCQANNDLGEAKRVIDMQLATVPNAPREVMIVERQPTIITLEVVPPEDDGGVIVSGYSVEYSERIQQTPAVVDVSYDLNETESPPANITYATPTVQTIESTDRRIQVENLNANTIYVFKVRAKNEVGLGNPVEVTATTDFFRRPSPIVINSVNTSTAASEYTVTWEKPKTGGQPIQQYKFNIRKVVFNKDTQQVEELPGLDWISKDVPDGNHILSYTVKDLSPNSYYQLSITAQNKIGWSEPSQEFLFSTPEDPNASPSTAEEESTTAAAVVAMTTKGEAEEGGETSLTTASLAPTLLSDDDVPVSAVCEEEASGASGVDAISQQAGASVGVIVGIVLAVFILFLIIVDVSCCFINSCGVLSIICENVCKKGQSREKAMEEGESNDIVKQPLPDDENVAVATQNTEAEKPTDNEEHHDKKPLLDNDEPKEDKDILQQERLNQVREEKYEDVKEPLKDEILLEHPKATGVEDVSLAMKKAEPTSAF